LTSLKENKVLLIICVLVAVLILVVYVFTLFWPRYEEYFFELGLLGRNQKAEDYFPRNTSTVEVGANVTWYIYLHNHMGSPQDVSLRVKVLNASMLAPDDRTHEPSPYPVSFEVPVSLATDETVLVPFSWSISEVKVQNDSVAFKHLIINGQSVDVNLSGLSETRFRLVFELWVYDNSSGEYQFFWTSKGELHSASIYMWFDVVMPTS
jgi:uncharacterized membrane protein